jgi:hypothetical protein
LWLGGHARGEIRQLDVDERQKLLGGVRVALLDGEKNKRKSVNLSSLPRGGRLVSLGNDRRPARDGLIARWAQGHPPNLLRTYAPTQSRVNSSR